MKRRSLHFLFWILSAPVTFAQVIVGQSIWQLEDRYGLAVMNNLQTSLLDHVKTGSPYDTMTLARWAGNQYGDRVNKIRQSYLDRDEFVSHQASPEWNRFVQQRIDHLKQAKGYLIPLSVNWGRYDFSKKRFDFENVHMSHKFKVTAYHCVGAFASRPDHGTHLNQTSCVSSPDLYAKRQLWYFNVEDLELAQKMRQDVAYSFALYAVGIKSKPYQVHPPRQQPRFLDSRTYESFDIAGHQPVDLKALLLVSHESGVVVAVSRPGPGTDWVAGQDLGLETLLEVAPLASNPSGPVNGWSSVKVGTTPQFLDLTDVQRLGPRVLIRRLVNQPHTNVSHSASSIGLMSYDCGRRTAKAVSLSIHSGPMGQGAVLHTVSSAGPVENLVPQSSDEHAFNMACNAAETVPNH